MKMIQGEVSEVVFKPNEFLFRENEKSYHFFILQEGEVEVFKIGKNGAKIALAVVGPGASLGEFAMIDNQPRSASAQAMSTVKAIKISDTAYERLLQDLPEWAISMMKSLVQRLRSTNEIVRRFHSVEPSLIRQMESVEYDTNVARLKAADKTDGDPDTNTDDLPDLA